MKIDLTRRRFLFGLAAVPLVVPAITHFVMPKLVDLWGERSTVGWKTYFRSVTTDYGEISQRTAAYAAAQMLKAAEPLLLLDRFTEEHDLPAAKGDTITFRRQPFLLPKLTESKV